MRGPSKWLVQLIIFLAVAFFAVFLFLLWYFREALGGNDAAKAAALQAIFAYVAIFPAVAALAVALRSETRATQAEARAVASEAEANEVRKASLKQAEATLELAQATRDQAEVMKAQEARSSAPNLVLVHAGGLGFDSEFRLMNLSAQNMFVQQVVWIGNTGESWSSNLGEPYPVMGGYRYKKSTLLNQGETARVGIDNFDADKDVGKLNETILRNKRLRFLEISVHVVFLHGPTGSALLIKTFKIHFRDWNSRKTPIITDLPVMPFQQFPFEQT